MCDSMGNVFSPEERHKMQSTRFLHRIRTASHSMPEFPTDITLDVLDEAFPDVTDEFQKLLVAMFVQSDGFRSEKWEDNRSTSGHWYGLSWGCIHYYTLWAWTPRARELRHLRWGYRARKCLALLRLAAHPQPWSEEEVALCDLAFHDPLPMFAFKHALGKLVDSGLLSHRVEKEDGHKTHMYYPTPALASRLEAAAKKLS